MTYNIDKRIQEIDIMCNKIDFLYHQIAIKQGLSDSAFMILRAILVIGEGCTQTNIYQSICINKQTINTAINNLNKNKIIYFENGKGRENKIYLTNKGKKIIKDKIIPVDKMEQEIVDEFSKEEYDLFLNLANRYINKLEQKINVLNKESEN